MALLKQPPALMPVVSSYHRVSSVVTPYDDPLKRVPEEPEEVPWTNTLACRLDEGHFDGLASLAKGRNAPLRRGSLQRRKVIQRPISPRSTRNFL